MEGPRRILLRISLAAAYRQRTVIERAVGRLEDPRAITGARYDTLAVNSLATVQVALIRSL